PIFLMSDSKRDKAFLVYHKQRSGRHFTIAGFFRYGNCRLIGVKVPPKWPNFSLTLPTCMRYTSGNRNRLKTFGGAAVGGHRKEDDHSLSIEKVLERTREMGTIE